MARNSLVPFRAASLAAWDPFSSLQREMNRLFDDVLRGTSVSGQGGDGQGAALLAPQVNVSETEDEVRVTAELPGVTEKDIQVDLNDDLLSIRGEKKQDRKEEKENYHFVERSYGAFQRSIQLPFKADPGKVRARFENGVLSVTLPKPTQQEGGSRIQIQGGDRSASEASQAASQEASSHQASSQGSDGSGGASGAQPSGQTGASTGNA